MSGTHREVRDIVKTVVCSNVRFINSCSIYRLAVDVLPFTEETIDDISLATRLIVPLLFLSLFPSPTPPLLRLPFLLALFFSVFAFPFSPENYYSSGRTLQTLIYISAGKPAN